MKDRIRSGAGFQRSLRFLNSDEQGMDSLELRLAVSRRILPALNRICERRFLRISFTSPGQVFVSPDGSVRLIVKDQSQVYQLKNLLPTLHREVEKASGFSSFLHFSHVDRIFEMGRIVAFKRINEITLINSIAIML